MSVTHVRSRPMPVVVLTAIVRGALAVLALAAILGLSAAGSVAAHPGSHAALAPDPTSGDAKLRDCWLSAAFIPTSAKALQNAFGSPLVLTQTFYGPNHYWGSGDWPATALVSGTGGSSASSSRWSG